MTCSEEKRKEQEAKKQKVSKRVLNENKKMKNWCLKNRKQKQAVDHDKDEKEHWRLCAHETFTPGIPNQICYNCDFVYSD